MIRIETSRGHLIDSYQRTGVDPKEGRVHERLATKYPSARLRTGPSGGYNCHGLTFLLRRAWLIRATAIQLVLDDDEYKELSLGDVLPGDIVIYYDEDGDPNHSGVITKSDGTALGLEVCSKWAFAGEFLHGLRDCPVEYGPLTRFFRCRR